MTRKIDIPSPPGNLSLSEEIVSFIVLKAREFDVKLEPPEPDPGSNATDSDVSDILSDFEDDATQLELADAIQGLNDDQKVELVALAWLGRGDFPDWREAVEAARDRDTGQTAEYLMGIPLLSDYLEEGLSQIGLSITEEAAEHSGAPNPRQATE